MPEPAKDAIYDQWAYEKLGVMGLPSLKDGDKPELLDKALAQTDEHELASGDALNHILVAIVAAENKGAKGPSAFLPPQLKTRGRAVLWQHRCRCDQPAPSGELVAIPLCV